MLERFLDLHEREPLLARAVEERVGQVPRIPAAYHRQEAEYVAALERILSARADVRRGDPAVMARLLFEIAEAVTAWLAHGRARSLNRAAALEESVEAVCRYVER
jgi:hypothetical protein